MNPEFMHRAIACSSENLDLGGGPFGAVVVKDGKIIAEGSNKVTVDKDPTAHAEVVAIRNAAKYLNDFNLSGCEIYTYLSLLSLQLHRSQADDTQFS
ncbi:MAG: nucleoside deaminase [Soonwooa sp.]